MMRLDGTDGLLRSLNGYKARIKKAEQRAVKKTVSWAQTYIAREAARASGIPVSALKKRVKSFERTDLNGYKVWAGAQDIPARKLAKNDFDLVSQMINRPKTGVKIGRQLFAGSFVMPIGKGKSFGVFRRVGRKRLPVKEVAVDVYQYMLGAFDTARPRIADTLASKLNQEVNYALRVEK